MGARSLAVNAVPGRLTPRHMDISSLLAGAVGGALFVGAAFALPRRARAVLVAGLLVAALFYVYFAVRARAGPTWLAAELAGVALYGGIAWRGRRGSAWWIAAAWALHPVWDVALHYLGPGRAFAPAWYATLCLSWDLVVAAVVAYRVLRGPHMAVATAHPASGPAGLRG
jgi:hypothetical protein